MDTRATISWVSLATENNLHHPSPNSDFDTQLTEMCQFLRAPDCVGNIDFDITPVKRERDLYSSLVFSFDTTIQKLLPVAALGCISNVMLNIIVRPLTLLLPAEINYRPLDRETSSRCFNLFKFAKCRAVILQQEAQQAPHSLTLSQRGERTRPAALKLR